MKYKILSVQMETAGQTTANCLLYSALKTASLSVSGDSNPKLLSHVNSTYCMVLVCLSVAGIKRCGKKQLRGGRDLVDLPF